MRRAGANLLRSGEAKYISPIVFCTYHAGQTHVFPMSAVVPRVPINEATTYTGTPILVSQYLLSSTEYYLGTAVIYFHFYLIES